MVGVMSPLIAVVIVAGVACLFSWIASLLTRDNSWVDRLWSIVPVVYVWIVAGVAGFSDLRLTVMAVLVTAWGVRLTFNFARKGGYSGEEDYRWAVLRGRMNSWQFGLFNLFFIVLYQNAILVLITLPSITAFENRQTPFGLLDAVLVALFIALLVGETVADQQQWNFYAARSAGTATTRFNTTGLWRLSRHPNFFFEQAQWWVIFLFGAVAAGSVFQWTVLGAFLLSTLFIGSTIFTEQITRSKYPEYAEYQSATSAVIPWFPRSSRRATGDQTASQS
jgi:steroid 5-alpha reductase family enzyme